MLAVDLPEDSMSRIIKSIGDSVENAFCPGEGARDNLCSSKGGMSADPYGSDRTFKSAGSVKTAYGNVAIDFDPESTSEEVAAKAAGWVSKIPQSQMMQSVAKRIEVFENPEDMYARMEEIGVDPGIEESGQVRGAFDFETGTVFASTWDGESDSPRTLFHEIGHSILGTDEDSAESWAQSYIPVTNAFCPTGEGGGRDNSCSGSHGTSKDSATKVRAKGFSLEEGKTQYYGAGVYFFIDPTEDEIKSGLPRPGSTDRRRHASGYGEEVLDAKLTVKNPYIQMDHMDFEETGDMPFLSGPKSPFRPEMERRREAGSDKPWGVLLTDILQEKGYDSVITWEDRKKVLVVFDPSSIQINVANAFCPTGQGGGHDNSCSAREGGGGGKYVGARVDGKIHNHAEKVKHEVAKGIGGIPEEETTDPGQKDKKPYDVKLRIKGQDHDIEVKSMTVGSKTSISVHPDSLVRKVDHAEATGNPFHTVVIDDRETYGGGVNKENFSGNRIYYKRGSDRYSLSQMQPVKDMRELKKLIGTPDDQLSEKAQGSLPSGDRLTKLRGQAKQTHESVRRRDKERKALKKDLLREQARRLRQRVAAVANQWRDVLNAFCPGEGARDNSCSSTGSAGSTSHAEYMQRQKEEAIAARYGDHGKDWEGVSSNFPGVKTPVFHTTKAAIQVMEKGFTPGEESVFGGGAGGNIGSTSMSSNLDWTTEGQGGRFGRYVFVMDEDTLKDHGKIEDHQAPDTDDYEFERRVYADKIPPSEIKGLVVTKHMSRFEKEEAAEWPFPVVYKDQVTGAWTKVEK